jgi:hypothetical protein
MRPVEASTALQAAILASLTAPASR